jgi:hypothetical protein
MDLIHSPVAALAAAYEKLGLPLRSIDNFVASHRANG